MDITQIGATNSCSGMCYVKQAPINKFQDSVVSLTCSGSSFFRPSYNANLTSTVVGNYPNAAEGQSTLLWRCFN